MNFLYWWHLRRKLILLLSLNTRETVKVVAVAGLSKLSCSAGRPGGLRAAFRMRRIISNALQIENYQGKNIYLWKLIN
jgi:hypothetical protein